MNPYYTTDTNATGINTPTHQNPAYLDLKLCEQFERKMGALFAEHGGVGIVFTPEDSQLSYDAVITLASGKEALLEIKGRRPVQGPSDFERTNENKLVPIVNCYARIDDETVFGEDSRAYDSTYLSLSKLKALRQIYTSTHKNQELAKHANKPAFHAVFYRNACIVHNLTPIVQDRAELSKAKIEVPKTNSGSGKRDKKEEVKYLLYHNGYTFERNLIWDDDKDVLNVKGVGDKLVKNYTWVTYEADYLRMHREAFGY